MRRHVTRPVVLVALWVVALASAAPVLGSMGVSIDVGRIDVSEDLAPGGEYRLPAFGVRNPGTEPTTYKLVVSYIDGQDAGRPAEAWFTFEPAELTLQPGESRPVQARLTLPVDSEPGTYAALIGPQIVSEGGGAQVGAAAAARLTFEVAPSSGWDAFLRWFSRLIAEQPALLVLPGATLLLLVLWVLRRRFSISIARRA
ncbi:MAG TPA: hypothetical protein VFX65_08550 [Candidatus Limnocylindrales bacterium]|nr:hypothetical protein [Candidatus Limnocylindrales bacterium]